MFMDITEFYTTKLNFCLEFRVRANLNFVSSIQNSTVHAHGRHWVFCNVYLFLNKLYLFICLFNCLFISSFLLRVLRLFILLILFFMYSVFYLFHLFYLFIQLILIIWMIY